MTDQPQKPNNPKAEEITQVAQELIQTQGYDGFSYRDIADRVGIRSATIHYYFPTKADLAISVARTYREEFAETVAELDASTSHPIERLTGFAGIFQNTLEELKRMCLCGMLASEVNSLSDEVRAETALFFSDQQGWLANTIQDGIETGAIENSVDPDAFAQMFLSALEGAMVMARSMERPDHLADVSSQLISLLTRTPQPVS